MVAACVTDELNLACNAGLYGKKPENVALVLTQTCPVYDFLSNKNPSEVDFDHIMKL